MYLSLCIKQYLIYVNSYSLNLCFFVALCGASVPGEGKLNAELLPPLATPLYCLHLSRIRAT